MYQVYKIKDKLDRTIYIGVTKDSKGFIQRFEEHKNEARLGYDTLLHKRMREEGIENFRVVLMLHNIPDDRISFYERLWVKKYCTYYKDSEYGCNMTYGGGGCLGYVFTDEVRKRQGLGSKAYWAKIKEDPEWYRRECQRRSDSLKGKPKSIEHRKKLSEIASKRVGPKNPFYGKHHSSEMKHILTLVNGLPVYMLDKNTKEILCSFESAAQAGHYLQSLGVTKNKTPNGLILDVCHGKLNSAYGYSWKFQ